MKMVMKVVMISCKIKFTDSAKLITTLLSNLADNLTEVIHKLKCRNFNCFLKYKSAKDNLMK